MLKEILTRAELTELDWPAIEAIQNNKLRAAAKYLLPQTPVYRQLFSACGVDPSKIRSVEDWKKSGLPLIRKKLFLDKGRDFIVRPQFEAEKIFLLYLKYAWSLDKSEGIRLALSALLALLVDPWHRKLKREVRSFFVPKMPIFAGGTEYGRPTAVLMTAKQKRHQMFNTAEICAYLTICRHFKDDDNLTLMNLFPYAPHIAWQIINLTADWWADMNLCTASGGFLNTEKLTSMAKVSAPNLYAGMIDYFVNIFLPKAIEAGVKQEGRVLFLNGGTKMLEVQRELARTLLESMGAKDPVVLDGYGASEIKEATLVECEEGTGLHHIAPLVSIIRTVRIGKDNNPDSDLIYDWDFTPDAEGGYAAIWNIDGAGTLLEGFLLGDHYDRIETGPCPHCGLNVQRIYNVNRIADLETEYPDHGDGRGKNQRDAGQPDGIEGKIVAGQRDKRGTARGQSGGGGRSAGGAIRPVLRRY